MRRLAANVDIDQLVVNSHMTNTVQTTYHLARMRIEENAALFKDVEGVSLVSMSIMILLLCLLNGVTDFRCIYARLLVIGNLVTFITRTVPMLSDAIYLLWR